MRKIPVAIVWMLALAALTRELSVTAGIVAAAIGAGAAVFSAHWAARSRLRLPAMWSIAITGSFLCLGFSHAITGSESASRLLGSVAAFQVGEIALWLPASYLAAGILRVSSLRYRAFLCLEIAGIAALLAGVLAAHRNGFINRPYVLVDWLWLKGYDPVPVFLGIGLLIAFGIFLMLSSGGSHRKSPLNVLILILLLTAIFLFLPLGKLDKKLESDTGGAASEAPKKQGNKSNAGDTAFADQESSTDNAPVAVVIFHDDFTPSLSVYYFRQTAFSGYNGLRLVEDTSGTRDTDLAYSFPLFNTELQKPPEKKVPFRLIDTTVALLSEHSRPFLLVNGLSVNPKENPDPGHFLRAYDARSAIVDDESLAKQPLAGALGSPQWDRDIREQYLSAPKDPRYAALSEQILKTIDASYRRVPFARAIAVKLWLEAHGTYSKRTAHADSKDPLADFLFGDLIGHCVYFAHSAALLMRTLGVPARVGAGYAVNARNRGEGSSLLVRAGDAHAWPEVCIPSVGWVPLDIYAKKSLDPPMDSPDQSLQQMMGEMARKGVGNPKDEMRPPGRGDLRDMLKRWIAAFMGCLPYLALIAVAILYGVKLYRRLIPLWCSSASIPRLTYRAALDRLAEAGTVRAYGESREAFAESMQTACPSFQRLTSVHLNHALGSGQTRITQEECSQLLGAALREIGKALPWWRRALAVANPIGWLRVN